MTMGIHYDLTTEEKAAESYELDVHEAVVRRYHDALGDAGEILWVELDVSIPTQFEAQIHRRISPHLDGVNLLETEMEMRRRERLMRETLLPDERDVGWSDATFFDRYNKIREIREATIENSDGEKKDIHSPQEKNSDGEKKDSHSPQEKGISAM